MDVFAITAGVILSSGIFILPGLASAIAQIEQDTEFEKRWTHAQSVKALRDLVLLGKRKRCGKKSVKF